MPVGHRCPRWEHRCGRRRRPRRRLRIDGVQDKMQDMIHFGLNLIDEYAIKCSELLKGLADAKARIQESVDHMRSQWISYSILKQEAHTPKDFQAVDDVIMEPALGNISNVYVGESCRQDVRQPMSRWWR